MRKVANTNTLMDLVSLKLLVAEFRKEQNLRKPSNGPPVSTGESILFD